MTQAPDNRPHLTVAVFGLPGHGKTWLLGQIGDALERVPGAIFHYGSPDGRLRCELPARSLELVEPPRVSSRIDYLRAALGADVVLFVCDPEDRDDERELARLIRLARAFGGAPLLFLNTRLNAREDDEAAVDRATLALRALFEAQGFDGDELLCVRGGSRRAIETLVARLLDTPIKPPGTDRLTIGAPLSSWREQPDELGLWIHLAQGSLRVGELYVLATLNMIHEFTVAGLEFGASSPQRVVAARHARVRARFTDSAPERDGLASYTLLDPSTAMKRPWSQVFELALTFFRDPPAYPPPLPLHHERWHPSTELALEFASGMHVPVRLFALEGGDASDGRYAWRVYAETERPHILVRRTPFVCFDRGELVAMGEVRYARARAPVSFPEYSPTTILNDGDMFDMGDIDIDEFFDS